MLTADTEVNRQWNLKTVSLSFQEDVGTHGKSMLL